MQIIELPFTTLEIHDGYVLGKTKEGVNLSIDDHLQVLDSVSQFLTPPYALVLDEINSYSIDFHVLLHVRNDVNVSCVGVVYHRAATKIALTFCQNMIDKPVYFSEDKNKVTDWVKEQIAS